MSGDEQGAGVLQAEVLAFADEAFRNRDITFSHRDVVDMTAALSSFLATQTRKAKTEDALPSEPDRFRKFIERIAAWTDEEVTVVDAKQCRHVAQVVIAGADPIYPPFGPSAIGWTIDPSNGGAA